MTNLVMKAHHLLECDAMFSSRGSLVYQRNVLPPSSGLKSKPAKIQASSKVACLIYCSTLKMVAASNKSSTLYYNFNCVQ